MIDLHAHLLPGVDDGPESWDEALAMLRLAVEDGVEAIVATPHQHGEGLYCIANSRVEEQVQELRRLALLEGLGVAVYAGGEVLASPDLVERLERGEVMTYAGAGRFLLLEFPASEVPAYAHQVIFALRVRGITPIIAHPERNEGFARHPEELAQLVEAGALAQLTASSISRRAAPATQELATLFLAHNLVHVMASDAHSAAHRPPVLARAAAQVRSALGDETAAELVEELPRRILGGEAVTVPQPRAFTRQSRREAARLRRRVAQSQGGGGWAGRQLRWPPRR